VEVNNFFFCSHNWDYRIDTGFIESNNVEVLLKFAATIDGDDVLEKKSVRDAFAQKHPQPFQQDEPLGLFQDVHGGLEVPQYSRIQMLVRQGGDWALWPVLVCLNVLSASDSHSPLSRKRVWH